MARALVALETFNTVYGVFRIFVWSRDFGCGYILLPTALRGLLCALVEYFRVFFLPWSCPRRPELQRLAANISYHIYCNATVKQSVTIACGKRSSIFTISSSLQNSAGRCFLFPFGFFFSFCLPPVRYRCSTAAGFFPLIRRKILFLNDDIFLPIPCVKWERALAFLITLVVFTIAIWSEREKLKVKEERKCISFPFTNGDAFPAFEWIAIFEHKIVTVHYHAKQCPDNKRSQQRAYIHCVSP